MELAPKILVFHTAFIGDIILTLPLVQTLRLIEPRAIIDFVAIPSAAEALSNHPAIDHVIIYDKKGRDKGWKGIASIARILSEKKYDVAIIPHRSLRSALIGWLARVPRRIGFSTSAGRFLFTDQVKYDKQSHEIRRNLALLSPLSGEVAGSILPDMFPSPADSNRVEQLVRENSSLDTANLVGIAPGSVWNTKRWPKERFIELGSKLIREGYSLALVGGEEDAALCEMVGKRIGSDQVLNVAGKLSVLQSAELIRRCKVLISNDSAPMHMAVAVRTPVVAIFGATVPEFGFAPLGTYDVVVETHGLNCRPCSIHGGNRCPIDTFECMLRIDSDQVLSKVQSLISRSATVA